MSDDFKNKVVIVTGAGRGLGRAHALAFAEKGALVVVNDLGGAVDGTGKSNTAQSVVDEIRSLGGTAVVSTQSVALESGAQAIIETAVDHFGTVDIVVNNAGILRDKTFSNLRMSNFKAVLDVHLMGSVYVTSAAWPILKEKNWGRVVFTSSGSGIFGNFGQANYGAAKMGLVGLMNVLKLEGIKRGIRVNTIAPGATTRMTEGLPSGQLRGSPDLVSPAVLYLCSDAAPNGVIMQASGGNFSFLKMDVSDPIQLGSAVTLDTLTERANEMLGEQPFWTEH